MNKTVYYIKSVRTGKKLCIAYDNDGIYWNECNEFTEFSTENEAWAYLERIYDCDTFEMIEAIHNDFEVVATPLGVSTDKKAMTGI